MQNFHLIKVLIIIQFLILIIQFILGMWLNLFATFNPPVFHPGMMMFYPFFQNSVLMAHMMVGMFLILLSLLIIIFSIINADLISFFISIINIITLLVAAFSGMFFVMGNFTNNVLSYLMSLGFIGTVITDFVILAYIK
ncbi:MAG: hypothetical protein QXG55_06120 [Thermoplasmata archaeon]